MRQRQVITIHGINTDGRWQDMVQCVLGPHFNCVKLKYAHYRRFGALRLLFHLPTLAFGIAVCLTLLLTGAISGPKRWGVLLVLVLLTSHIASRLYRRKAVDFIARAFSQYRGIQTPDFIGHSLGTYLCGSLLLRGEYLAFSRMILTGCVLPATYPWKRLISNERNACASVRNEVGKRDIVVWTAFFLHGWLGQFGRSGYSGFSATDGTVHNLNGSYDICRRCKGDHPVLVHNIKHSEVGHSDLFITPEHCDSFWLPFLLGIHPKEYRDFSDYCIQASFLELDDPNGELPLVVAALFEEHWQWAGGTLADALRNRIGRLEGGKLETSILEPVVDTAMRLTWRLYTAARSLQCKRLAAHVSAELDGQSLLDKFLTSVGLDDQPTALHLSSKLPANEQDLILRNLDFRRLLDQASIAALTEAINKDGLSQPTQAE
jgi:pimeloyl-ACP methyl ester carboxylesterase